MARPALALTPWAPDAKEESSLKDILARVALERGHFRDITEASLQEEIAGEGALELSDDDDDEEDEDKDVGDQANTKPTTREQLYKAKYEMLQDIASAENDVLMMLDFISLLHSKDAPNLARTTMSPALRQELPVGTLGADIWSKMPVDRAREAQDELIATNVRMESLQKSADGLLDAANRLQDNVRKETQYWGQILSISEKGWNVCRIPGQQHRLGVTFGFSESAPEFSRRGIASLNASSDGTIVLERGVGTRPRTLRVQLKKGDVVIGSSKMPIPPSDTETTLEARIRYARDSLFDEELFHEMIRESRSQASRGVTMKGNAISYRPQQADPLAAPELLFELVPLDLIDDAEAETRDQDRLAQALALAARLLLTQAHRERLRKRSEVPPPLSDRKEVRPTLPILRPLMSFMLHQAAIEQVNAYTERISKMLTAASIGHTVNHARLDLSNNTAVDNAEALTTRFMQPWLSNAELEILDERALQLLTLRLRLETTLSNSRGTVWTLTDSNYRILHFNHFDEIAEAGDTALASGLAKTLSTIAGAGWKCNEQEALLSTVDEEEDTGRHVWITVNGMEEMLSLSTPTKKILWSAQPDGEKVSFWDAWSEVVS